MKITRMLVQPARKLALAAVLGSMVLPAMATGTYTPPVASSLPGRMTGGGSLSCGGEVGRVTFGFQLHCGRDADGSNPPVPNNLEINFDKGSHFHLDTLNTAFCGGDPTTRPKAPFSVMTAKGFGEFTGESKKQDARIEFVLQDVGEPGAGVDKASFTITTTGKDGDTVLKCGNYLEGGNIQAHRATGSKQ